MDTLILPHIATIKTYTSALIEPSLKQREQLRSYSGTDGMPCKHGEKIECGSCFTTKSATPDYSQSKGLVSSPPVFYYDYFEKYFASLKPSPSAQVPSSLNGDK